MVRSVPSLRPAQRESPSCLRPPSLRPSGEFAPRSSLGVRDGAESNRGPSGAPRVCRSSARPSATPSRGHPLWAARSATTLPRSEHRCADGLSLSKHLELRTRGSRQLARVLPLGPTCTTFTTKWLVHRGVQAGRDYDLEKLTRVWRATNEQDRSIVQENVRCRAGRCS